jgi:ankyrin repeat protein
MRKVVLFVCVAIVGLYCLMRAPSGAKLAETPFQRPAAENNVARMKTLLEQGLDVNAQDDNGSTAIFYALGNGHIEMAEFLLSKGARLDTYDRRGYSLAEQVSRTGPERSIYWLRSHGY